MNKSMMEQLKEEIFKDWNEGREICAVKKLYDLPGDQSCEIMDKIRSLLSYIEAERFDRMIARYAYENIQN